MKSSHLDILRLYSLFLTMALILIIGKQQLCSPLLTLALLGLCCLILSMLPLFPRNILNIFLKIFRLYFRNLNSGSNSDPKICCIISVKSQLHKLHGRPPHAMSAMMNIVRTPFEHIQVTCWTFTSH